MVVNKTHTYKIYENSSASEYVNIFDKTYIELVVSLDSNGVAHAEYEIKAIDSLTGTEAQDAVEEVEALIQEYIDNNSGVDAFLESYRNSIKLNIPNPRDTVKES